ncbi:MAG: glucose-6-phosphate dehydrogenase, partial [Coriobacteriales bacterium]|nr:glucose-6-phosphate dehydrogenase [Coriobacteriales bacterium]
FGTTGDLMARKVVPSLLHLWQRGRLPERFRVIGFGRREWDDARLREHIGGILDACCSERLTSADRESFLDLFCYQFGHFDDPESYESVASHVQGHDDLWDECSSKLFYLAVPPEHYATILGNLAESGLTKGCSDAEGWTRVLLEKPFGDDEQSSRELDHLLEKLFKEEQVYRIDHYLAKEMLQGVMNFRFQNNLLEPAWNRDAIERIEINLLESIGVEKRGAFYDRVGALRDVGQNHLLQMLALVTMDQPASPGADDIRQARARAIEALRPPSVLEVAAESFRAQHDGYRAIEGVAADSDTETYFMLRTQLTGPRWTGVPVTMQSGKRMGEPLKNITVTFRQPPECMCDPGQEVENRIRFELEPADAIRIDFWTKKPGFDEGIEERSLDFFLYEPQAKQQYVEEYATLLHDAIRGDQTLFVSSREVEAGWRFTDPWVEGWRSGLVGLERYEPDTATVVDAARRALARPRGTGEVGVVGLGKMGAGLARNLMSHGWRTVGFNRTTKRALDMRAEGLVAVETLSELAAALMPPRVVWVVVPSGAPVDAMLFSDGGLAEVLEAGDVIIDGGNSYFRDAPPRAARLAERGILYLDCGTSGGPTGAREGACLMIGGEAAAFERNEPMFADIAVDQGYGYFGPSGAGHFAKMVHNGIEYGMMQAIAEGFSLLHSGPYDLDLAEVARVYQHGSVVESRLVGWLQGSLEKLGGDLENVSGVVGHTGEGQWTIETAAEEDVDVPVIRMSLQARVDSVKAPNYAGQVLTALRNAFGGHGLGPAGGPRR